MGTQHLATSDATSIARLNELSADRVEIEDSFVEKDVDNSDPIILAPAPDTPRTTGEQPSLKFDRYIVFEGQRMLKSRALSLYAKTPR